MVDTLTFGFWQYQGDRDRDRDEGAVGSLASVLRPQTDLRYNAYQRLPIMRLEMIQCSF